MDPTSKKKVGSLLEALEALTNCFNLKELEDEIVEILSPIKSETSKKKDSFYDSPSTSKYDPGFSFVRHQQNSIPGLSIPEEKIEKPPDRSGFGDGKFVNRIMPGISFGSKEKTVTDAFRPYEFRGRGANFNTRRFEKFKPYVKEETPSSSLSYDNRIPKPETGPFAERKVSQHNERDPRYTLKTEDSEGRHDRNLDEQDRSFSPHRRDSYNSGQQRYPDRGGMSSSNRGYDNRGRGVSSWHDNRGGRGFGSNRGYDNRGGGPSGSNRGQDRGRPFNSYRGPSNRGQGNDHRGGRRGRRRGRVSLEEQERVTKEMEEKKDEVAKKIRERIGLPVGDDPEKK